MRRIIKEPSQHAQRLKNQVQFHLERLMVRGAQYRLLVIAFLIASISLLGGTIVWMVEQQLSFGESVWWAFLRLTDPGYLGDDQGALVRIVSTLITVLGYVLFMGALIAIMTQWLHERMRHLEMGLTPITKKKHLIILGWTNRTPDIVRDVMLSSGRVQRFLIRLGARKLDIVVLAEEVSTALVVELREELGFLYDRRRIIMRSGTPLRLEHLRRVDFLHSSVIVLPTGDYHQPGTVAADTRTIKTILSISKHATTSNDSKPPLLVAELFDVRKVAIAERAYAGPIEIIAGDAVVSRLIAHSVRHQGLSFVFRELLTQGSGNEIYVREFPSLSGRPFGQLMTNFCKAIPIGVVRWEENDFRPILCPDADFKLIDQDKLVLVAREYEECEPSELLAGNTDFHPPDQSIPHIKKQRRLLILGWSRRVPPLLREFDGYENETYKVDIVSRVSSEERVEELRHYGFELQHLNLRHLNGDFIIPSELEALPFADYDNIIMVSNDRLESEEESDARTIAGYLLLTDMLKQIEKPPLVLLELMDVQNSRLLLNFRHETLITPQILSHMLVQVALRRELNSVFDDLFASRGPEITMRKASDYGLGETTVRFPEVQSAVATHGDIALGVRVWEERADPGAGIRLNPPRNKEWKLTGEDEVVVLTSRE